MGHGVITGNWHEEAPARWHRGFAFRRRRIQCKEAERVQSRLIFDVLHKTLATGVKKFSFRDVAAAICINLREVDDEWGGG